MDSFRDFTADVMGAIDVAGVTGDVVALGARGSVSVVGNVGATGDTGVMGAPGVMCVTVAVGAICFVLIMALMATPPMVVWVDWASGFQVGDYCNHSLLSINHFQYFCNIPGVQHSHAIILSKHSWRQERLSFILLMTFWLPLPWWYAQSGPRSSSSGFGLQVSEQISPSEVLHYYKQSVLSINHFQ